MTYKELQSALKELRANGYELTVKLNAKRDALQAEYDRILGEMTLEDLPDSMDAPSEQCDVTEHCDTPSQGLECDYPEGWECVEAGYEEPPTTITTTTTPMALLHETGELLLTVAINLIALTLWAVSFTLWGLYALYKDREGVLSTIALRCTQQLDKVPSWASWMGWDTKLADSLFPYLTNKHILTVLGIDENTVLD